MFPHIGIEEMTYRRPLSTEMWVNEVTSSPIPLMNSPKKIGNSCMIERERLHVAWLLEQSLVLGFRFAVHSTKFPCRRLLAYPSFNCIAQDSLRQRVQITTIPMKLTMWNFISVDSGSKNGCKWNFEIISEASDLLWRWLDREAFEWSSRLTGSTIRCSIHLFFLLTDTSHGQSLSVIWFSWETKEPLEDLGTWFWWIGLCPFDVTLILWLQISGTRSLHQYRYCHFWDQNYCFLNPLSRRFSLHDIRTLHRKHGFHSGATDGTNHCRIPRPPSFANTTLDRKSCFATAGLPR
jgi:hypothetical protein